MNSFTRGGDLGSQFIRRDLVAEILGYADHHADCEVRVSVEPRRCTCGFSAIVKVLDVRDVASTEEPFTRGEVRRMLIWAAKDSSCFTGETFAQIADRVLKEEGR